jgi:hypothetical protein
MRKLWTALGKRPRVYFTVAFFVVVVASLAAAYVVLKPPAGCAPSGFYNNPLNWGTVYGCNYKGPWPPNGG